MKATLNHIQINVSDKKVSYPFYKELLALLGFKMFMEDVWGFGMSNEDLTIWVMGTDQKYKNIKYHRKGTGLNHIAFKVAKKEAVDLIYSKFLKKKGIVALYKSPKTFPEYAKNYYAVYFEDPDRLKLEVVSY